MRISVKHDANLNHKGEAQSEESRHIEQILDCSSFVFRKELKFLEVMDFGGNTHVIHGVVEFSVI